jgi:hypothetical protein
MRGRLVLIGLEFFSYKIKMPNEFHWAFLQYAAID